MAYIYSMHIAGSKSHTVKLKYNIRGVYKNALTPKSIHSVDTTRFILYCTL